MFYNDAHRHFLQTMTLRRSLDEREAVQLMDQLCKDARVKVPTLDSFVHDINSELRHMQLALRTTTEEREDGDYPCLVLVNLMPGEATRELSSFTKQELSFMQRLVGQIVTSNNGEVEMNIALNLGPTLPQKMKISACEDVIQHLIKDKWLISKINEDGEECLSLSALIVVELATYLEETYPDDILKCFFCTRMTFRGYRCDQCNISVHRDCGKKYWATRGGGHECPGEGCSASLDVNESSSQNTQSKRRRSARNGEEEERMEDEENGEVEDEVEEQEEEEEEEEVVQRGRRRSRRNIL